MKQRRYGLHYYDCAEDTLWASRKGCAGGATESRVCLTAGVRCSFVAPFATVYRLRNSSTELCKGWLLHTVYLDCNQASSPRDTIKPLVLLPSHET